MKHRGELVESPAIAQSVFGYEFILQALAAGVKGKRIYAELFSVAGAQKT